ncbi:MAG TPA: 1-acyl-sn-glycerol-3-phosphate acyltransferase [bacterium]|nr:1-acyl-sn-glycerol-3-phosphate acyltransferase [bacterium]
MANLSRTLEDLFKAPRKTLESLLPAPSLGEIPQQLKKLFSFEYDDSPVDQRFYGMHRHWLKLLHDYYFNVEHAGHVDEVADLASREKVILISNHANTLEAAIICYYFYLKKLGIVRSLVFKEAFRLPIVREIFKSGQCLPISVAAGKEALKRDHILLFPEGMDFIKHYIKRDYVVKFHKGFLNIAREYLLENPGKKVHIIPVGHDGIDYTIKFWIINQPFLVEKLIKPYLHYPYFVLPKAPLIFPTKAIFNWGRPREVTLEDLKGEKSLIRLTHEFRGEIVKLRHRARALRKLSKKTETASS